MLNIIGEDLDIDVFLIRSKLSPHKKTYKGAPKFKTKPDGERIAYSVVTFKVSDAPFDNFKQQVEDSLVFLRENQNKLECIAATEGVQFAVLDFGVRNTEQFSESAILPKELLKLAGYLGLDIEISLYS